MMKDKKQTCKDVYDRYHKFPGDTSEGRVLTVLFSIIGAIISLRRGTSICIIFIITEVCVRLHNFSVKRKL